MPIQKLKFIEDKTEFGLEYDWDLIRKEYKRLNCPAEFFDPTTSPLKQAKYFVDLSDRSTGKTTGWLLLGLIMYWQYGTQTQYIRQNQENIAPKYTRTLYDVVLENNYIEIITDGVYNSIVYQSRSWYLCKVDESGNIVEKDDTRCCFMLSIDKAMDLKSSYNAPFGDFIVFDEFIGDYYYPNEFVKFCDAVKTIIRERQSPIIVMLANTINKHSQYFNELEVYDEVQDMQQGDHKLITTDRGTKIYVEILGATVVKKKKRSILNKLFFGFHAPELASITGEDWAVRNYQHIPDPVTDVFDDRLDYEYVKRNIYIYHNSKYLRLDIVKHINLGICVYVHWATKTYPDSIILTCEDRFDKRFFYRLGPPKLAKTLEKLFKDNRFYYASNDVGSFMTNYMKYITKVQPY